MWGQVIVSVGAGDDVHIVADWLLTISSTHTHTHTQEVVKFVAPQIVTPGHALRLRALQDLTDRSGVHRATGEEWLVRESGAYLPDVFEEVRRVWLEGR